MPWPSVSIPANHRGWYGVILDHVETGEMKADSVPIREVDDDGSGIASQGCAVVCRPASAWSPNLSWSDSLDVVCATVNAVHSRLIRNVGGVGARGITNDRDVRVWRRVLVGQRNPIWAGARRISEFEKGDVGLPRVRLDPQHV